LTEHIAAVNLADLGGIKTKMLASFLQSAWLFGAIGSAALVIYGGWLVYLFQSNSSVADQRTVARLALHESSPSNGSLAELKTTTAVYWGSVKSAEHSTRKAA
jgi:hypothetical protein